MHRDTGTMTNIIRRVEVMDPYSFTSVVSIDAVFLKLDFTPLC
jgi:hypothetical protein